MQEGRDEGSPPCARAASRLPFRHPRWSVQSRPHGQRRHLRAHQVPSGTQSERESCQHMTPMCPTHWEQGPGSMCGAAAWKSPCPSWRAQAGERCRPSGGHLSGSSFDVRGKCTKPTRAHSPPCKQQQLSKNLSVEPLPTPARHLAFVEDKPSAFVSTTPSPECVRGWLLRGVAFVAWGLPLGPVPSR